MVADGGISNPFVFSQIVNQSSPPSISNTCFDSLVPFLLLLAWGTPHLKSANSVQIFTYRLGTAVGR